MGNSRDLTRISKFLSLVLRHKPEEIGIELDEHGWADVEQLVSKMGITYETLHEIVRTDSKGRYEYDSTKTKIRARQGHSINVDVELEEREPPNELYHGTVLGNVASISMIGLQPMSRKYVHLSSDMDTAISVGGRHRKHGKVVVYTVDAKRAYNDGVKFYISRNNVWLSGIIDAKYLKIKYIDN